MITRTRKSAHLFKVLVSYLLLAFTDVVHHLHAALMLAHESALHAVVIGIVLIPTALIMFWCFGKYGKKVFVALFLFIVATAVLLPGIYHGGWHHGFKLLTAFGTSDKESSIGQLLPSDNLHLWFYEISGVTEFIVALVCAYFIIGFIRNKQV